MKLRNIIYEDQTVSLVNKYLARLDDTEIKSEDIERTKDGININGSIQVKPGCGAEIPVQLNVIHGSLDIQTNIHFKSFKNFPKKVKAVHLYNNQYIDFKTEYPIEVETFYIKGCKNENFSGLNLKKIKKLTIKRMAKLTSLLGLDNIPIDELEIMDCPNFEENISLFDIKKIKMINCPKMPFISLWLSKKLEIDTSIKATDQFQKILDILSKNKLQSNPENIFNVVKELRVNNFNSTAKL